MTINTKEIRDWTKSKAKVPVRVHHFESKSRPGLVHELKEYDGGTIWCSCPAWVYSGKKEGGRTCPHYRKIMS